jgi:hypothetical protein
MREFREKCRKWLRFTRIRKSGAARQQITFGKGCRHDLEISWISDGRHS